MDASTTGPTDRLTGIKGVAPLGRRPFPCNFYCSCNARCLLHVVSCCLQLLTFNFYRSCDRGFIGWQKLTVSVARGVQVWCCTLSNDGEVVVSGSRDRTIRLWRASDGSEAAAVSAGVDVFRVLLSDDQRTIVALADRRGARKLIMLRVVRTKLRTGSTGSRTTSPPLLCHGSSVFFS